MTDLAAKLKELGEKATPIPWSCGPAVPGAKRCFNLAGNNDAHNRQVDIGTVQGGYYSCEFNAALIVALRNALPQITTALREAARLREALEKIANHATGGVGGNPAGFVQFARAALESPRGA